MFCFILFFHAEISQTMMFHATLFVFLKNLLWARVHQLGLKLFGAIMWKLLIIEPHFQ